MRSSDWSSDVLFRSAGQVRLRAERLGLSNAPIQLAAATSVRDILTTLGMMDTPSMLVIDSIQTMHSDQIEGAPGTVRQVRGCAFELIRYAKEHGVTLILVGIVHKDRSEERRVGTEGVITGRYRS